MNWVDAVIVGVLGLALVNGFRRGAVLQVFSWGGFFAGIVAGSLVAVALVHAFNPQQAGTKLGVSLGAFLIVAFLVEGLVAFGGSRLARKIVGDRARMANAVGGSGVAALAVLSLAWMLTPAVARLPEVASSVRRSAILRTAERLAHPPNILAVMGALLDRTGFPEVFAQLNPSLAPGVDPPPAALARDREVLAAARLTYKIESNGCAGRVNGSGFPVSRDTVVTAAHVVAGTNGSVVIAARDAGGDRFAARVVYMDTNTDIAVLRVPTLPSNLLPLGPSAAGRGTDGAAIGYPGGGDRRISVARVRARTEAIGRDIYSRRNVTREIYVLRAVVRQGNSGGPFVDEEGSVRGMIFAASATNNEESYALTETEIRQALQRSAGRSAQVNTGRCAI